MLKPVYRTELSRNNVLEEMIKSDLKNPLFLVSLSSHLLIIEAHSFYVV